MDGAPGSAMPRTARTEPGATDGVVSRATPGTASKERDATDGAQGADATDGVSTQAAPRTAFRERDAREGAQGVWRHGRRLIRIRRHGRRRGEHEATDGADGA